MFVNEQNGMLGCAYAMNMTYCSMFVSIWMYLKLSKEPRLDKIREYTP